MIMNTLSSIKDRISNARYFLEAADKHPSPTKDAVHILLLLIGWENIALAREELSAWANKSNIAKDIYKSHVKKLERLPGVTRITIDKKGKPHEKEYRSGKD